MPRRDIRAAVERNARNPEAAARELIDAANSAGGKDNVTVLVIEGEQFTGAAPAPALPKRGRFAYYAVCLVLALHPERRRRLVCAWPLGSRSRRRLSRLC